MATNNNDTISIIQQQMTQLQHMIADHVSQSNPANSTDVNNNNMYILPQPRPQQLFFPPGGAPYWDEPLPPRPSVLQQQQFQQLQQQPFQQQQQQQQQFKGGFTKGGKAKGKGKWNSWNNNGPPPADYSMPIAWVCNTCGTAHNAESCWICRNALCRAPRPDATAPVPPQQPTNNVGGPKGKGKGKDPKLKEAQDNTLAAQTLRENLPAAQVRALWADTVDGEDEKDEMPDEHWREYEKWAQKPRIVILDPPLPKEEPSNEHLSDTAQYAHTLTADSNHTRTHPDGLQEMRLDADDGDDNDYDEEEPEDDEATQDVKQRKALYDTAKQMGANQSC